MSDGNVRFGIFGDIHGNLEALEAVIAAMRADQIDRFLCLGDIVGYGADPGACVERVRALEPVVVAGNHDLAAVNMLDASHFNPFAREALLWTRDALESRHRDYLTSPNLVEVVEDLITLFHSTLQHPEQFGYIQGIDEAEWSFSFLRTRVGFFGHSHVPAVFAQRTPNRVAVVDALSLRLSDEERVIVNPGSVGQPRDGDPRAAYAVFDTGPRVIELRRVHYDVGQTQAKIRRAGLPEIISERLSQGL